MLHNMHVHLGMSTEATHLILGQSYQVVSLMFWSNQVKNIFFLKTFDILATLWCQKVEQK